MKLEIPGYPGYFASEEGVIYGKRGKSLKGHIDTNGYIQHLLLVFRGGKRIKVMRRAHQLIALTFIPNPLNKPTVNHEDGVRVNNQPSNLRWATRKEQIDHSYKVLNRVPNKCVWKDKRGKEAAWCKTIILSRGTQEILRGSQTEIAKYLGYSNAYIGHLIKNNTPLSGNYTLKQIT